MRALERCIASGRTLVELGQDFARQPSPFADWNVVVTQLEREPEELNARIDQRTDAMLKEGLVGEVRGLLANGLKQNPSASGAIGYREVIDHIENRLAESELAGAIASNTRRLVKKQRTWFRTQLPEHRVMAASTLSSPQELFPE